MMKAPRSHAVFFTIIASVYYAVFLQIADLKDTAIFGGDTWEYQSMAVNFAKGHGVQKFGALESFSTYKFEMPTVIPPYYDDFIRSGHVTFYRTPAYSLLLGAVYKLFGVSPKIAKGIQLLLLVVIAASLPLIGAHYWGRSGFIGGLGAGAFYLATNYRLAELIMTEALAAFAVFLVLLAFMAYEQRQGITAATALGGSLGFALLVKGTLIFLPLLTGSMILVNAIINRDRKELQRLLVVTVSAIFFVAPWSFYASAQSRSLVILATQGGSQLLSDNNEFCTDGRWHPEWRDNKNSFYNTDGIDRARYLTKVVNFYWHHPTLLPRCMAAKFMAGFGPLPFLWIFMGLALLDSAYRIANRFMQPKPIKFYVFAALVPLGALTSATVYHATGRAKIDRWVASGSLMVKLLPLLVIGLVVYLLVTGRVAFRIPRPFWLLWANFLLMTLVFHAEPSVVVKSRLIAPVDFLFALTCCVFAVSLFSEINNKLRTVLFHRSGGMESRTESENSQSDMHSSSITVT